MSWKENAKHASEEAERLTAAALQASPVFPELSPREREVALRLAMGDRNSEVAETLGISIKTVDTHRGHLLKKLRCRNNVDLARLAIRRGYVQP